MDNKNLIILCVCVLLIVIAACTSIYLINSQVETNLIASNLNINKGDNFTISLVNDEGTKLSNQNIYLSFTNSNNETINYTVKTDDNGLATIPINLPTGSYSVTGNYEGIDNFKSSSYSGTLEVNSISSDTSSSSSESSSFEEALEAFYNDPDRTPEVGVQVKEDGSKWVVAGDGEAPYGSKEAEQILRSATH